MGKFIAGQMDFKPRPYLRARMPGFVNRAKFIAAGFAAEHGYPAKSDPPAPPDPALIPIGQKLSGKAGGFGCVSCHAVAGAPALAAFEAPAPNFAYVKERIRKDYYTRWTRNPQRVEPGTRMPSFADYEGKTAIKDPYDGDSKKQFEAIWNYLQTGRQITPPG
jgi:mono/diheme cytochrome c family protein